MYYLNTWDKCKFIQHITRERAAEGGKKTKITIPENLDKNENPKIDIDRSNLHEK